MITAFSVLVVGLIAGLEGSGFRGLPLTGSLSGALASVVDMDPSTLAAIGQSGQYLVRRRNAGRLVLAGGGGRVRPGAGCWWLARKCFLPVMGRLLILATTVAIVIF